MEDKIGTIKNQIMNIHYLVLYFWVIREAYRLQ